MNSDLLSPILWSTLYCIPEIIASAIAVFLMMNISPRPGRNTAMTGTGLMLTGAIIGLILSAARIPLYNVLVDSYGAGGITFQAFHGVYSLVQFVVSMILYIGVTLLAWGAYRMAKSPHPIDRAED